MIPKEARKEIHIKLKQFHQEQVERKKVLRKPHDPCTPAIQGEATLQAKVISAWMNLLNELCGRAPCHGKTADVISWWQGTKDFRDFKANIQTTAAVESV